MSSSRVDGASGCPSDSVLDEEVGDNLLGRGESPEMVNGVAGGGADKFP